MTTFFRCSIDSDLSSERTFIESVDACTAAHQYIEDLCPDCDSTVVFVTRCPCARSNEFWHVRVTRVRSWKAELVGGGI